MTYFGDLDLDLGLRSNFQLDHQIIISGQHRYVSNRLVKKNAMVLKLVLYLDKVRNCSQKNVSQNNCIFSHLCWPLDAKLLTSGDDDTLQKERFQSNPFFYSILITTVFASDRDKQRAVIFPKIDIFFSDLSSFALQITNDPGSP